MKLALPFLEIDMTATYSSAPEVLRLETIREMLRSPGPCITILQPPFRPGEPAGSPGAVLRSNIQEAARRLARFSPGRALPVSEIADLLQPLERLAEDPAFVSGSRWGRAIFRSPKWFHQFHLTQPVPALLHVGGCFAIRPLALEFECPRVFYILALSKMGVSLLRCAGLQAEVAPLPPGVPDTLAAALALEPPDHDLENRSAVGRSTGTMHSIRFGTGSGREQQHGHLADYYKMVDRGLHELFGETAVPLILAGVDEETAMYRAVSTYPHLVKNGIQGSTDVLREQAGMLQQSYSMMRTDSLERQAAALIAARERTKPSLFSTDPETILNAAFEGRVSQIYLHEGAEKLGVLEQGAYQSWGQEDLLNVAAVQTTIHQGKSCELPAEMMPDGLLAAALLRF